MRGGDPNETDWPQYLPWSLGKMDREAKARLVGRRILALRDQRRFDGPGHRVEILLSGGHHDLVRFRSASEIVLELDHRGREERPEDEEWEGSRFVGLTRAADRELRLGFLELWETAKATTAGEAAWERFDLMMRRAGFWVGEGRAPR